MELLLHNTLLQDIEEIYIKKISNLLGLIFLAIMISNCSNLSKEMTEQTQTISTFQISTNTATITNISLNKNELGILYVCNDGFIITANGRKIAIDALFHDSKGICKNESEERVNKAQAPFDNIDIIFISHNHWDHFDSTIVNKYLQNNPDVVVVAEIASANILINEMGSSNTARKQILEIKLERKQIIRKSIAGIDIEVFSAPADVPNLGFLIQIGQYLFLHSGDSGNDDVMKEDYKSFNLSEKKIDFAFLPYWYLSDPIWADVVKQEIDAKKYIPMHYAGEDMDEIFTNIKKIFPEAIYFTEEWQLWRP